MNEQPEALRLADVLETFGLSQLSKDAAVELRRLHAVNGELLEALNDLAQWFDGEVGHHMDEPYAAQIARAAIAKAEGKE